jgi:MFS family permease
MTHRSTSLYSLPSLILALIVGLSYIGLGFLGPLYALYGREIGATNWEIGLMSSAFLLAGFIATPLIGWLADWVGPRPVLGVGLCLHALITLSYIPLHSPSLIIGLRALEGAHDGCPTAGPGLDPRPDFPELSCGAIDSGPDPPLLSISNPG